MEQVYHSRFLYIKRLSWDNYVIYNTMDYVIGNIWFHKEKNKFVWEMVNSFFDKKCTKSILEFLTKLESE